MVNKIVQSYWNTKGESNLSGFNTFKDFLASTTLSMLLAKSHFEEVELVTNDFGKSVLIDKLDLPYTSVNLELNKWDDLNPIFWAFCKIVSYSIQKMPFIHIDNDVFLIQKPSEEFLNGKLCFQSIEEPFEGFYGWYKLLLQTAKKAKSFPTSIKDNPVDFAFNCGVAGGNDLEIMQQWIETSKSFILNEANEDFFSDPENLLIHQNLLHEQYFIASIAKQKGYRNREEIKFILNSQDIHEEANGKYAHLWGTTKRIDKNITRVYNRLKRDYPEYYERIINYK